MTELNQIYKCNVCGNIVEVVHASTGQLVCCVKPMELKVEIRSVPHPMEKEHYIEWIEVIVDSKVQRKFLKPGDKPEAEFCICSEGKEISAREYCNVHGLWKA